MKIITKNSDVILQSVQDFDLTHIFDCGQCFRWNKTDDNTYTGVAKGRALTISQHGNDIVFHDTTERDFCDVWYNYFDFDTDYGEIKEELSKDSVMREAISYGDGIRILNQDLWETVVSFIISASNNIPRIKGIVERLCGAYGDEIEYGGNIYYSFPSIERMSALTKEDLGVIRAGFRDKYIVDATSKFRCGDLSADALYKMTTPEAKKALMTITGVGNKVSDCILLFGLKRADSFPVDVWIKRIMEYCYFDGKEQPVNKISAFAEEKFGKLGGYAQQYLFFYARENKLGLGE